MISEIERKTTEIVNLSTEKERIGAELELVRNIQASMLPIFSLHFRNVPSLISTLQ